MISFFICLFALILSYFIYGRFLERIVGVDGSNVTPAYRLENGVDYVPMNKYKNLLIHFLNIAGLGPIFGAIQGALFGPAAFLWIVLGWGIQGLPEFSFGYVNLLQFVFLTVTSLLVSGYAANLASKISVNKLKILQVIVISYIGLQMIGVFDIIF